MDTDATVLENVEVEYKNNVVENENVENTELSEKEYLQNMMVQKKLLKSNYKDFLDSDCKTFTIKNKKTKQIFSLKAPTAVYAAKMIGWKPRHVVLIQEKD